MTGADELFAAHDRLRQVSSQLQGTHTGLQRAYQAADGSAQVTDQVWGGPAAQRFATGMGEHAVSIASAAGGYAAARRALDDLGPRAQELAREAQQLERDLDRVDDRLRANDRAQARTPVGDPQRPSLESERAQLGGDRGAARGALLEVERRWKDLQREASEAVAEAAGTIRRASFDLAQQTPASFGEVAADGWAHLTSTAKGFAAVHLFGYHTGEHGGLFGRLLGGANYVRRAAFEWRRAYGRALREAPRSSPLFRMPPGRTWANSGMANRLLKVTKNPAVQRFATRAGVAGSVTSTVTGTAELIREGNMVDAYQDRGAGYVADVAAVGFSASTAAFLLVPHPVTAGAVVVTGTVWVVPEVVDRRETIARNISDTTERVTRWADDTATSAVATATTVASNVASTATDVASSAATKVSQTATSVASTATSKVGDVLDSGAGMLSGLNPLAGR